MASPTSRTIKLYKDIGFECGIVERRVPFRNTTIDLYGFADLIAMKPGVGIIAVQATSGGNHAARRAKIAAEPRAKTWLESGGRIEICSWAKRGGRGKRKLWTPNREEIK